MAFAAKPIDHNPNGVLSWHRVQRLGKVRAVLWLRSEQPLQRVHESLNTLFDRLWRGWPGPIDRDLGSLRLWDLDVTGNDKEIVVRAETPGFDEKELNVQITNDVVTIRAEKEERGNGEEEHRTFFRSITLPAGIDAEKARAIYRNGVLELHIPAHRGRPAQTDQGRKRRAKRWAKRWASRQRNPGRRGVRKR